VHDAGLVDRGERRRGGHGEAVEGPGRGGPEDRALLAGGGGKRLAGGLRPVRILGR
jgi:hypothetical protein